VLGAGAHAVSKDRYFDFEAKEDRSYNIIVDRVKRFNSTMKERALYMT
jgi:hypothetical protein